ncbi:MAG: hypothetical protein FWD40_09830 [Treponema sp.]|nr:hypothetical protein [Treponema sp.]
MKRTVLAVVFITCAFFGFFCERVFAQAADPIDLVLVLDTSTNMSSSYEYVSDYVTGAFLNEFLRVGDTFHLIPFSARPRLDIARRISGIGDVETIIGRMLLQYPVERGNNVGAALTYTEQYLVSLPGRPKKVVLITTGSSDTNNLVTRTRSSLAARNTTFDFVQVNPGQRLTNLPVSGRSGAGTQQQAASQAGTSQAGTSQAGSAQTAFTPSQTDSQTGFTQTGTSAFDGSAGITVDGSTGIAIDGSTGITAQTDTSGVSSAAIDSGAVSTGSTGGQGAVTAEGSGEDFSYSVTYMRGTWLSSLPVIIAIIIGILLLLALILFLASRRLGSSPNKVMASVSSPAASKKEDRFVDHSKDLGKYAAASGSARRTTPYENRLSVNKNTPPVINPSGPLLLNLFVEDQSTSIGKRNIHSLKSGYSFSVGGGRSDDYLIFLVPFPAHIGEIRRNRSSLTFIPRKPKYFPDIGSNEVHNCINNTIRIISDKNYEVRFRFEMYEDPLEALNRMLMCVKVPG